MDKPRFFWERPGIMPRVMGGIYLLMVILMWAVSRTNPHAWVGVLGLSPVWLMLPLQFSAPRVYVIHGGTLAVISTALATKHVPLPAARATRVGERWELRWPKGRVRLHNLPGLGDALAAGQGAEEAADIPVGLGGARGGQMAWLLVLIGALVLFYVAALLFNQPLWLAPVAVIFLIVPREWRARAFALTAEHLWVAETGSEPVAIPLTDVARAEAGPVAGRIDTRHPEYPVLKLNNQQSGELIRRLHQMLKQRR